MSLTKLILSTLISWLVYSNTIVSGAIYQYYDGDSNGSLFLTDLDAEPFANLSGLTLHWADLAGVDLSNAYLSGTNLFFADLRSANLTGAYLHSADMNQALMSGIDLSYAYMLSAQLSGADLSNASLEYAFLTYADFSGADLSNADLSFANLTESNLQGADLSGADLSQICGCFNADFLNATYDDETMFADDMDPDALGMIFVPTPGALALLAVTWLLGCSSRRRSRYNLFG